MEAPAQDQSDDQPTTLQVDKTAHADVASCNAGEDLRGNRDFTAGKKNGRDRVRLRRLDLYSLDGAIRENERVYRLMASRQITALDAEARSRVIRRQLDMIAVRQQTRELEALRQKLAQLDGRTDGRVYLDPLPGSVVDYGGPL